MKTNTMKTWLATACCLLAATCWGQLPTSDNPVILTSNLVDTGEETVINEKTHKVHIACPGSRPAFKCLTLGIDQTLRYLNNNGILTAFIFVATSFDGEQTKRGEFWATLIDIERVSDSTSHFFSILEQPLSIASVEVGTIECQNERASNNQFIRFIPHTPPMEAVNSVSVEQITDNKRRFLDISWALNGTESRVQYYSVTVQDQEYRTLERQLIVALENDFDNGEAGNVTIKAIDLCGIESPEFSQEIILSNDSESVGIKDHTSTIALMIALAVSSVLGY